MVALLGLCQRMQHLNLHWIVQHKRRFRKAFLAWTWGEDFPDGQNDHNLNLTMLVLKDS